MAINPKKGKNNIDRSIVPNIVNENIFIPIPLMIYVNK
jgi:hypothetical protein